MGGKQSTSTTATTSSSSSPINTVPSPSSNSSVTRHHQHRLHAGASATAAASTAQCVHRSSLNPHQLMSNDSRQRARSLSHVPILSSTGGPNPSVIGIGIPTALVNAASGNGTFSITGSPGDSDGSSTTPDESTGNSLEHALFGSRVYAAHSLPTQLSSAFNGIKCPVCCKFVIPDDLEYHLVMCLTKPRISYNEDVLAEDKGECVICLDDLQQGDTIARLPCLCIYHKCCIDSWFEVNRSCPEHPSD